MAYYENITAGCGAIDSFANALNSQRFANLMLNETISNFSNNITRAGALYDEAKIREDALKYQRMQDFYNNKRKDEAFELEKKQAELNMDFAKRQQRMRESEHKQNTRMNEHRAKALDLENKLNKQQQDWLMKANAKPIASVDNNKAMKTPTKQKTLTTQNALNTLSTPKPKTISKEEFKAIYANPMFRF
ncbi:hypothetical protein EC595_04770 [Helicobacter pylori]|uniref:hypothetical protein n=1 Tax=Helicobacter pylori TaxID=210 RepID=UPI000FDDB16E|nr:hypothetical protein [Helicobacter pylori]RVZ82419.1 hypothetical protein EC595_04770 [Helicobacter pylori]